MTLRDQDLNTDKGEVGGSNPPRPTIQITNKYAAILTFPLSGNISQKTDLPTICQLYNYLPTLRLAGQHYTQDVTTVRVTAKRLASIRLCRERCPLRSKDVQGSARHFNSVEREGRHCLS